MPAKPCKPGCECRIHTHSGPSKCPVGCQCPKHQGRKCQLGCVCGLHSNTKNRRNQFSDRIPGVCHACGESDPDKFKKSASNGSRRTLCRQCVHDREFKKRWALTYSEMLQKYGTACNICGGTETVIDFRSGRPHRLAIDHDHAHCLKGCRDCIRGLLCRTCNYRLGVLEANPEWTGKARGYLDRDLRAVGG